MNVTDILTPELLDRLRSRAAGYDRDNSFFTEDLEDLRAAGYLALFSPREAGGAGFSIPEVVQAQRLLATAAPATALAVNMHQVWCGVAHLLSLRGDDSLSFVLEDAVKGELYAFGVSEPGNAAVLFDSFTAARPQGDGSYAFTGTKIFTSLSPAWTRLGIFGRDDSDPDEPRLVFGFAPRGTAGITIKDDWNTMGMRASQSCTTVLDNAVLTADQLVRTTPVGPHADAFVFGIFSLFETLLSAVYTGVGDRAVDLAVAAAQERTTAGGGPAAHDPFTRWKVADAAIRMDGIHPQLEAIARDLEAGTDHGSLWFPRLSSLKYRATETARSVVETAVRVSGGRSYSRGAELERLYRDVLAGMFHPSSEDSVHNSVANAWLGPVPGDS
ncbi:acyl-CoA dehydrogenase family protein [Arthrobacter sp. zg-Y820]|uniref:acyl-CoA dehydrogenase family protein n=1 Tax=unclassified Arthrobacter TaxID=235627 RepID=UPI0025421FB4|nr:MULTISPECIES: acyl-CoA dehydrogenase family protein [unclassified Arthrobacter]MCC9196675.1 acyl-CoA/acyl-ACP dehydrogenase [Arthrobacter sp. zg-Y820]MDK1279537.1 acyl-CoA dehydrogenase family protein [Arthrobacter sp. zg.Y820]WIB08087.1 acyl-CoA dehydrogenase family protein [Arthrobacter sp. zg-Y820]